MVLRHTSKGVIRTSSDLDDTDMLTRQMTIGSEAADPFTMLAVEPLHHHSASMRVLRHSSTDDVTARHPDENDDERDLAAVLRACNSVL